MMVADTQPSGIRSAVNRRGWREVIARYEHKEQAGNADPKERTGGNRSIPHLRTNGRRMATWLGAQLGKKIGDRHS
jgi:hypothetical protein